jgi:plasmid stabilization system protein ParE
VATIRWTVRAQRDLREIRDFTAMSSPENARALTRSILDAVARLEDFPRLGRTLPEFERRDLREIVVAGYRALYAIKPVEVVEIQAIYHSSRDLRRVLRNDPLN